MSIEESVRRFFRRHPSQRGQTLVLAVSGGADSLCLLHVLLGLRDELGLRLHVGHLDHGLRGQEGAQDAVFVAGLAERWGVPATVERADVAAYRAERGLSLEDAARQVRYDMLARLAAAQGAPAVATGHTADDQVETILLHLLRGAGLAGLRGMKPVQELPCPAGAPLVLLRPLLDITHKQTEDYCLGHGLQPRHDASNDDEDLRRNRLRRTVLPLLERENPGLRAAVLRSARILGDEDDALHERTAELWRRVARQRAGMVVFVRAPWQRLGPAWQRRLLREAWQRVTGGSSGLELEHVDEMRALVAAGKPGQQLHLPLAIRLSTDYERFYLAPAGVSTTAPPSLPQMGEGDMELTAGRPLLLGAGGWIVRAENVSPGDADVRAPAPAGSFIAYFDAAALGERLLLRRPAPGERMQPLGMASARKLQDILVDERVPRAWRARLVVVQGSDGRIAWVVGLRTAHWARVTPATERVLRLTFEQAT